MIRNRFGKIGILAGGPSSERGISLKSGESVYNALSRMGCDVLFIDIKDNPMKSLKNQDLDIAFIALHGGFGEDGTVQHILEGMNILYTGSGPDASRLALDKVAAKKNFREAKILIPDCITINRNTPQDELSKLFIPAVIKPVREGSSIGLSIIRRRSDVSRALQIGFKYSDMLLVEKFIEGKELTVGILDNEPLPVIEIVSKENVYDYEAKYQDDETSYVVPALIGDEKRRQAQDLGIRAHKALGCRDFSRVDMRMDEKGNIFVLEVNTIPGLTERSLLPKASQAVGITFEKLCVKLLELALQRRR